ncbi:hypothetical protein RND81_13G148000 [Saponaria officinalis]|uniref:Uncharacterized protein n=1 Tax=Saponaria officinalis TaxID=3572 RepID=A0AAW1H131_SAPOF
MFNSRNSSTNPSIISNILRIIKWNIQVRPNKHLLPLQVGGGKVTNTLLRHQNHPSHRLPGGRRNLREDVAGECRIGGGESEAAHGGRREEVRRTTAAAVRVVVVEGEELRRENEIEGAAVDGLDAIVVVVVVVVVEKMRGICEESG